MELTTYEVKFIRDAFSSAYYSAARDAVAVVQELFADDYDRELSRKTVVNVIWPEGKAKGFWPGDHN